MPKSRRFAAPDTAGSVAQATTRLPEWNLADLYEGVDSSGLKGDLAAVEADATRFEEAYKGKLAGLPGKQLGAAIAAYEKISETLSRLSSYAQLLHAGNMSDATIGQFYQTLQERVTDISSRTLFFALEINRVDDATLAKVLGGNAAKIYGL